MATTYTITSEPGTRSISPLNETHWACDVCGGKAILKVSRAQHLTTAKHLAAVADAAAAAEAALMAAEQTRKQAEENEKIVAEAQVKAAMKAQKKQQKKLGEQQVVDARAELEAAQHAAKQTKAALQELMRALAEASDANDRAEMAVMAAQQKVVDLTTA
jgi:SWI/SNF-related matrix-associated actin-dependent regulator 1 of chromatin subfamily A